MYYSKTANIGEEHLCSGYSTTDRERYALCNEIAYEYDISHNACLMHAVRVNRKIMIMLCNMQISLYQQLLDSWH